jgi:hypothetical protein
VIENRIDDMWGKQDGSALSSQHSVALGTGVILNPGVSRVKDPARITTVLDDDISLRPDHADG